MNENKNLITCKQLHECLNQPETIVLDGSWYLPGQNRDAEAEFREKHIPNARYFDIDQVAERSNPLPHMMPTETVFSEEVEKLGVSNSSRIVVYDGVGLMSAARVWWLFRAFGHENIQILDGGLPAWVEAVYETTSATTDARLGTFHASLDRSMLTLMPDIQANCKTGEATILDARSRERFTGEAPEPRPELKSGHIPGSTSLPFTDLVSKGRLKSVAELQLVFDGINLKHKIPLITTCGSGVTAAIITLALDSCGYGMQSLYDGSWTEWASNPDNPIA